MHRVFVECSCERLKEGIMHEPLSEESSGRLAVSPSRDGRDCRRASQHQYPACLSSSRNQRNLLSVSAEALGRGRRDRQLAGRPDAGVPEPGVGGLRFLSLRHVKGFGWNHKPGYRSYRELELNLPIEPKNASYGRKRSRWRCPRVPTRAGRWTSCTIGSATSAASGCRT